MIRVDIGKNLVLKDQESGIYGNLSRKHIIKNGYKKMNIQNQQLIGLKIG